MIQQIIITNSSYPKLLVVCESPFGIDNGFGVTLTSLLENWPAEDLGLFYVSKKYLPENRRCIFQSYAHIPGSPRRLNSIPFVLGLVPEWKDMYSARWLSSNLRGYEPDLVYTFFHSVTTLKFGTWISKRLGIPHVLHVGDDCLEATPETAQLVRESIAHFAISKNMAKEYETRYDTKFEVFHNGAAAEFYQPLAESWCQSKPERVIRYLGRIHSWLHYDSLRLLSRAISLCRAQGYYWKIEIYGHADKKELEEANLTCEYLSYCGHVNRIEGIRLLHESDLLVLPFTYSSDVLKSYRLSFPTKFPEYLATGIPILLLSHPCTATAEFSATHKVCHLIGSPSVSEISSYLMHLWNNPQSALMHGRDNATVCRSFFNQKEISASFQAKLIKASNAWV